MVYMTVTEIGMDIDQKLGYEFKAMEHPDDIIDMVIILTVNVCPCKRRYKLWNWWDQRKGIREGL